MIANPRLDQKVQVWYRKEMRHMPHHGKLGTVRVVCRGKPRNHGIEINGVLIVVPCGNLRPFPGGAASNGASRA